MTWLLDVDGVVWLSGQAIAGSADAIDRLRRGGEEVVFFTNNSGPSVREQVTVLADLGIPASADQILTSGQAAAVLLEPGSRAAVIGGPGVREALVERGVELVAAEAGPGAVVVGRTTDLSYDTLAAAATAIRTGARFVATNDDATMPTPDGPVPGAGAIIAFLRVASGVEPEVAGKPNPAAAELVSNRVGPVEVLVGDRPDTDGLFAQAINARFALVFSGVTAARDLPVEPPPQMTGADLAAIVDQCFGSDERPAAPCEQAQAPGGDW